MLKIALRSLRRRWMTQVGTFVAVALGVALMTVMGLGLAASAALPDGAEVVGLNSMLGTAGGVSSFVAAFVVASTFSYAVAARRRELGLLRLAGSTPGQLRRLVMTEAAAVGLAGSAAGIVLGRAGAPLMARWTVTQGLAPAGYAIGDQTWPLHTAFWTGLLVALSGAYAASRRAGRVGPLEALREAVTDERPMTPGRWVAGGGLLLGAVAFVAWRLGSDPGTLLKRKTYTWQPMLLISACGMLAPVLVRPVVRLLMWVPVRLTSYAGRVVRANAAAGIRRTAAVAAPVLVMVALTGSLLGAAWTVTGAKTAEARARTGADYVLTGGRLPDSAEIAGVPAGSVLAVADTRLTVLEEGFVKVPTEASAVDPAALAEVSRLPVVAGSVADLDDGGIIVTEEWWQHRVGDSVPLWRADGTAARLRIVAVMRTGTGNNGAYVTPRNAPGAEVSRVEVRAPASAAPAVRAAAARYGATAHTKEEWLTATHPRTNRFTVLGYVLVLGIALLYTAIALANTLLMATSDRAGDLRLLRLAGATRGQVLAVTTAESLLAVAVGTVLGTAVTAVNLAGMRAALAALGVDSPVVVPWLAMGAVAGLCAVLAALCTLLPAARALRRRTGRRRVRSGETPGIGAELAELASV
ncbi:FtsX-like permease family protein [Streptomyces sp. NBC_00193]|uniref:FtsX-like permease family protein n=1 Tax=Streptomyces sp. NBC_00193 TaxID=2975675 RepID=UPI00225BD00F|nr:FtsX-like permease family protein [Streptomyces sp. NBC_00193]MCX5296081.1 FtsX-like permease family protein [Streptomyces sp. NBC_00193]